MTNKINIFQKDLDMNMQRCIEIFKININKIHIGRVSPNMLESVTIEYYGTVTPILQLVNATIENPRTLMITIFDTKIIKLIEKAIVASNLGLIPVSCGNIIRVTLPLLTEDRRRALIKVIRSEAEKSRISIRNIRRSANEKIKVFSKNKEINEDEEYYLQNIIQKLTNLWIKKIDLFLISKESDLMNF